jgi:hypothetical protein
VVPDTEVINEVAARVHTLQGRALARIGPTNPLAVRLRTRLLAESAYQSGGPDVMLAAVERAGRSGDAVALAEALTLAQHCLVGPEHAGTRLGLAEQLLGQSAITGRRVDVLFGLMWRTVRLFLAGDARAERSLTELRSALAGRGHRAIGFVVAAIDVMDDLRAAGQGLAGPARPAVRRRRRLRRHGLPGDAAGQSGPADSRPRAGRRRRPGLAAHPEGSRARPTAAGRRAASWPGSSANWPPGRVRRAIGRRRPPHHDSASFKVTSGASSARCPE